MRFQRCGETRAENNGKPRAGKTLSFEIGNRLLDLIEQVLLQVTKTYAFTGDAGRGLAANVERCELALEGV
jgi:hypothetical protein